MIITLFGLTKIMTGAVMITRIDFSSESNHQPLTQPLTIFDLMMEIGQSIYQRNTWMDGMLKFLKLMKI